MKATLEFNLSDGTTGENQLDLLLCLKARAMHEIIANILLELNKQIDVAIRREDDLLNNELARLRDWVRDQIECAEVPGL
jgi:hypothetical protein